LAGGGRTRLTAAQRRESILAAAADVFAEVGYRAGRVSDVAARVGVSEPVVFQNFGSKAALFAAVLDRVVSGVHAEADAAAGHGGPAAELLAHVLGQPHTGTAHGSRPHRALFAEAAALVAEQGAGEPAARVARVLAGHLADLIRRGQAEGDVRADLDPEAAAWLLLSVMSARPLRTAAMPNSDDSEPAVAALTLRALLPPARGQEPPRSS
jgi:AcrR family transcriptional regulator